MRRFQVGLGRGFPPTNLPFPGIRSCGEAVALPFWERPPEGQIPDRPCASGLVPAGGGAAPSQLMLAAKGGFIRVPLKEMLIVTFLHD